MCTLFIVYTKKELVDSPNKCISGLYTSVLVMCQNFRVKLIRQISTVDCVDASRVRQLSSSCNCLFFFCLVCMCRRHTNEQSDTVSQEQAALLVTAVSLVLV